MTALALYTTIYPGVEPYLRDWYRSVLEQTDSDFELWIGFDAVEVAWIKAAAGADMHAHWVPGEPRDTPAQIRQRALAEVVANCDAVLLVDSDDVMHPSRVASARGQLQCRGVSHQVVVDESGGDLGACLRLPSGARPEDLLPRRNVFGLSNSAFRSHTLGGCLPIPAEIELVDWFLVVRAWLSGAKIAFDNAVGMDYRQHSANMVRVVPPFSEKQVARDTERLARHMRIVLANPPAEALPLRLGELHRAVEDVETFRERVVLRRHRLEQYVSRVNQLDEPPVWGACVANPLLRDMWMSEEETA